MKVRKIPNKPDENLELIERADPINSNDPIDLPPDMINITDANVFPDHFLVKILQCDTYKQLENLYLQKPALKQYVIDFIRKLPNLENNKISQAGYGALIGAPNILLGMIWILAAYTNNDNGEPLIGSELSVNIMAVILAISALLIAGVHGFATYQELKDDAEDTEKLLKLGLLKNIVADELNARVAASYFEDILLSLSIDATPNHILLCQTLGKDEVKNKFENLIPKISLIDTEHSIQDENKLREDKLNFLAECVIIFNIKNNEFNFLESKKSKYSRLKYSMNSATNVGLTLLSLTYFTTSLLSNFNLPIDLSGINNSIALSIATPIYLGFGSIVGYKTSRALLNAEMIREREKFLSEEWVRKIDTMRENCEAFDERNKEKEEIQTKTDTLNNKLEDNKATTKFKSAIKPKIKYMSHTSPHNAALLSAAQRAHTIHQTNLKK